MKLQGGKGGSCHPLKVFENLKTFSSYIHTYNFIQKLLKRGVWRLTLYYNSPEEIKVKCVKLCTEKKN